MTQLKVVGLIATTLGRDSNFRGLVSTDWLGVGASYVVRASCRLQWEKLYDPASFSLSLIFYMNNYYDFIILLYYRKLKYKLVGYKGFII